MPVRHNDTSKDLEPWESSTDGSAGTSPGPDHSVSTSSDLDEFAIPLDNNNSIDYHFYAGHNHITNSIHHDSMDLYWKNQEDLVISGISCRLPESDNMEELAENLFSGTDMITEDGRRWEPGFYDLPRRSGKLKDLRKFDASFFGVHPKQANTMDPQLRMLLEVTYEAIVDSGACPQSLRGNLVGVFVGCSGSETGAALTRDPESIVGYSLTGCVRSMFANRISYAFDFRGPSYAVDTACSSGLQAMQLAVDAIRTGQCDAALVAGTHLTLTPTTALQFLRLGMLSPQGMCRSFDNSGDGYVRAEGIVAIFIQKQSRANRVYCTVVHAKANTDGYKEQGITFPSGDCQAQLLREVYSEAGINPADVVYIETHGTGTKVGDPQEANAITEAFCTKERTAPLLIGSIKSNLGHCEPTSGLASVAKLILAMQTGYIPANLHYKSPNEHIPGLLDGRLKVVSEKTAWNGGVVGINSFGFGGSNVHVILKSFHRPPESHILPRIPKLLFFSGRTFEAVDAALKFNQQHAQNDHVYTLLSQQANVPANLNLFRGYTMYNRHHGREPITDIQKVSGEQRPVWFVYSGMGTQWPNMGRQLMKLDPFRRAVQKCSETLKPFGLCPYSLITEGSEEIYKNTLNSFVCIATIQIALTDVLKIAGVEPSGILGHSVGELGCGYADGCMTAEETVLCAYWRGKCVQEAQLPPGAMAAVGLSWEEVKVRAPSGVVPACHNSEDSVTISGPADAVKAFIEELQEENVFAKEVATSGVAFHSYYMQQIAHSLKLCLDKVISVPKLRSDKWISSSIPENEWSSDLARYCSSTYHVNNLTSPVLFYEGVQKIPENAVVIEVAPHCLLQAVLKRTMKSSCVSFGLMKAKHEDNLEFLLTNLAKVYQAGVSVDLKNFYPSVVLPVPSGTPMLSSLVKWDHSQNWPVLSAEEVMSTGSSGKNTSCSFVINPYDPEAKEQFLLDHVIDGRILFPFTGYLVLVWKAICRLRGLDYQKTQVILEDIRCYRATIMSKAVKFDISVSAANGQWEIMEGDSLAASGTIQIVDYSENRPFFYEDIKNCPPNIVCERIELKTTDIYKEMLLRGYEYGPHFRGIHKACNSGDRTTLYWTGNWITFIDCLLQTALLRDHADTLKLPVRLRYLRIDPIRHFESVEKFEDTQVIQARNDASTNGCIAGGIEVCELIAQTVPRRIQSANKVTIEKVFFVSYFDDDCFRDHPALRSDLRDYGALLIRYARWGLLKLSKNSQLAERLLNQEIVRDIFLSLADNNVGLPAEDKLRRFVNHPSAKLLQLLMQIWPLPLLNGVVAASTDGVPTSPSVLSTEDSYQNMINLLKSHQAAAALDSDLFVASSWLERPLKICIDVALENTAGHFNRCCHFEPRSPRCAVNCRTLQESHPLVEVEWTLIGPNVDKLDEEAVTKAGVSKLSFDLETAEPVPDNAKKFDLVLLDRVLHKKADIEHYLERVKEFMREDGFALVCEVTAGFELAYILEYLHADVSRISHKHSAFGERRFGLFYSHEQWLELYAACGFHVVVWQRDVKQMTTLYLLHRVWPAVREPAFVNIDDVNEFSWIKPLQDTIEERLNEPQEKTIWLLGSETMDNGINGLSLCLREENSKNRIRSLFDASVLDGSPSGKLTLSNPEVQRIVSLDLFSNVYRDGVWGSLRHIIMKDDALYEYTETEHAFINTLVRGDLSSLSWVESPNVFFADNPKRLSTQFMCSVYFASLNFRDIMLATGRLAVDAIPGNFADRECLLGMEFSGRRNSDGKRVMGLLPAQALATTVVADNAFTWDIPAHWSLEQAATVPVVYTTVFYALVVRGNLRRGEKVLVHSGSGGVGQAAISVALSYGCEVFTSVSSEEKRTFLKRRFPQLKDKHFTNSRTCDFEYQIMHATKGRGVDIVLNSLSDDKLQASVRCLAANGRFLEIGKMDLSNNSNLGMSIFLKNVTFHGILLDSMFDQRNGDWLAVSKLLTDGIASGVVQPLPATVFGSDRPEDAFRFMAQGKHIGKVLMKIRDEETPSASPVLPKPIRVRAVIRTLCHPRFVYVITGGLGGFGLELAQWLINRGARKLVLTSRNGIRTGYQARLIYFWRRQGVSVSISTLDIANEQDAFRLVKEARDCGTIGGIFHLAMVLRDCLFENQTVKNFRESSAAKYWGTRNLDQASRKLCDSKLRWFVVFSSISCGRGNSGQTNYGWANSTMERIIELRRAAGYPGIAIQWGAIGDVGVVLENMGDNSTVVGGTIPQRMPSCLATLDLFLSWNHPIVSSYIRAETGNKKDKGSNRDVVQTIAHILGVSDVTQLDADANLGDLGLDSLMGVEIKQALERDFDVVLSMKDIRTLTLNKLKTLASTGGGAAAAAALKTAGSSDPLAKTEKEEEEDLLAALNPFVFFNLRVDIHNLRPEEPVVLLNSVTTGAPIFCVHSIEGVGSTLNTLASKINQPVYCFQCIPEAPLDSIESLASFYTEQMKRVQPQGPYRLIGYSYGACVAFEMAVHIQHLHSNDPNIIKSLILLDGSHAYMQHYKRAYRLAYNVVNDAIFETEVLCAFTIRFTNIDYKNYRKEMMALEDWQARVKMAVAKVMSSGLLKSSDQVTFAAESLCKKIRAADKYSPHEKFQGDVTLIKAAIGTTREEDVGADYGISKVISGTSKVFAVEGDHDTFVHGTSSDKTASIIMELMA